MSGVPRPGTYELVEDVRRIARDHGYAVGVHGSLLRDLDLIACPWTSRAHAASTLVRAIEVGLDDFLLQPPATPRKPTAKRAHGRLGWVFLRVGPRGPAYLDLSVMARFAAVARIGETPPPECHTSSDTAADSQTRHSAGGETPA